MAETKARRVPLVPYELLAADEVGEQVTILPCRECAPWHVELYRCDGRVMVREWHAESCAHAEALRREDERADETG